ncbi:hypothetical protein UFOVP1307_77 [uncultured Caudovirales phage]|uniref:Uncharacterized protein n=1 Tax=uncultured Caudovirales phage TaxID=2100421 RepID=A0A6J5PIB4_9CAUD|nr:hypothetical protein UFOVP651_46 [uncultured Caudovirales phage]CAB4170847.1 hypothetical protein UFOVP902_125 [uncultured Caudovirales phage]CAB4198389.1 hypothetical protein UFOVP1307_77 [uncultured Caudovirales phage]
MSLQRIKELSDFENLHSSECMQDALEEINALVVSMITGKSELNVIELTNDEYSIVSACIEVVEDLPCGFDAIAGYHSIEEDELYNVIDSVKGKV